MFSGTLSRPQSGATVAPPSDSRSEGRGSRQLQTRGKKENKDRFIGDRPRGEEPTQPRPAPPRLYSSPSIAYPLSIAVVTKRRHCDGRRSLLFNPVLFCFSSFVFTVEASPLRGGTTRWADGPEERLFQGQCSHCAVMLMFPAGASAVECARCGAVTSQATCTGCSVTLLYPPASPVVECAVCGTVLRFGGAHRTRCSRSLSHNSLRWPLTVSKPRQRAGRAHRGIDGAYHVRRVWTASHVPAFRKVGLVCLVQTHYTHSLAT